MNEKQSVSVFLIGIEEKERHLLKGICQLSQSRKREYRIQDEKNSDYENYLYADIAIVDRENLHSVQKWKEFKTKSGNDFSNTTVFLSKNKTETNSHPQIQKPLIALRVLNTLDSVEVDQIKRETQSAFSNSTGNNQVTSTSHICEGQKILVIDDSLPVRKHLELELEKFNCEMDFCENAEDGLKKITNNQYDLVFLDVVLPGMDGYELCKQVKRNKQLRSTPVVMLTSKSSPFDKVRGSLAGCDSYLTKPVNINDFNRIVERYLKTRQALEA